MVKSRFSLDTNILVYAVDMDAGPRHEWSKKFLLEAARCDCVLTVQALGEFFHATTRKNLLTPDFASDLVHDWYETFRTVSADDTSLLEAMDASREHRLSFWDAMLWATARQAGCATILSEDMQDGRRLGGVQFLNPFDAGGIRLSELLGTRHLHEPAAPPYPK